MKKTPEEIKEAVLAELAILINMPVGYHDLGNGLTTYVEVGGWDFSFTTRSKRRVICEIRKETDVSDTSWSLAYKLLGIEVRHAVEAEREKHKPITLYGKGDDGMLVYSRVDTD